MKVTVRAVTASLFACAVLFATSSTASAAESRPAPVGAIYTADALAMPPQPPQLSREEQEAVDKKNNNEKYDVAAYKRAMQKQVTAEKYAKARNSDKQRGQPKRR